MVLAQEEMRPQGLAGWLVYDFRGKNPVAAKLIDFGGAMLTRRWFLFLPSTGEPTLLVHAIEVGSLQGLPFTIETYSSRESLVRALDQIVPKDRVALEYSPLGDIPYVSHVDAGTVDLLRSLGVTPVSSADILQQFNVWNAQQVDAHLLAAKHVVKAKDLAFEFIAKQLSAGANIGELDVQGVILSYFQNNDLETDHAPIIGFGIHSSDPHYSPSTQSEAKLKLGDVVLIDLWAKHRSPHGVYADITWMGCYGPPSTQLSSIFDTVARARDLAISVISEAYTDGRYPHGFEIDQRVREFISQSGYGENFTHRTGHSLGSVHLHGEGANLDDYETHDTRKLIPGLAITVEPGIYLEAFGVRTEINIVLKANGPWVTTPLQRELSVIAKI